MESKRVFSNNGEWTSPGPLLPALWREQISSFVFAASNEVDNGWEGIVWEMVDWEDETNPRGSLCWGRESWGREGAIGRVWNWDKEGTEAKGWDPPNVLRGERRKMRVRSRWHRNQRGQLRSWWNNTRWKRTKRGRIKGGMNKRWA